MRVCVSSAGRFHSFDLARELHTRGYLRRLYSGFPRRVIGEVPPESIDSFPFLSTPLALFNHWGLHALRERIDPFATEAFDNWVAGRLAECDVFHHLSSFGLRSGRRARRTYGSLVVCDRGSTHILVQDKLLSEEFRRWGVPYTHIDSRIIDREVTEYEECDLLFVPSRFALDSFLRMGTPREKLAVVPYGVDLQLFKPSTRTDNVFRILFVGAVGLQKGVLYLLEALEGMDFREYELWLIGGVSPEVKRLLPMFQGRFKYHGIIQRSILPKYYSQASVLVLPSIQEGLALVQAEAMACGVPVVTTPNSGALDLIEDGVEGFVVPIRDPVAIRSRLEYLHDNPEVREQMARAALERVRRIGGWGSYGKQVVETYMTSLRNRRLVRHVQGETHSSSDDAERGLVG